MSEWASQMEHEEVLKFVFWTHFRCVLGSKMAHFQSFWDLRGAKMATIGLKMGSFHLFAHPKGSTISFGKTHFEPILNHFWSKNGPL